MRFSRSPSDVTFESLFGSTARLACALIALWILALWSSLQWYLLGAGGPFGPVVDMAAATDATLFCVAVAWLFVARPRVRSRDGLVLAMVLLLVVSVAWITPGLVAPSHIPQPVRVLQMMVIAFGATVLQLLMAGLARSARASLHMAYHDPLTELPNRRNFAAQLDAEVDAAAETGATVSVLFIDLDRFKLVNDSLGHAAGDALLCAVSDRIRARAGQDSLVARQSGDEFLVMLRAGDDLEQAHTVRRLAQEIQADLERPFAISGRPVSVGASVGYAAFPADAADGEHLIQHADRRMYEMKQSVRGVRVPTADPLADLECASRLRVAIAAGELEVHYQPVVSLADGEVRSCEALVRWRRDGRLVPPGEFLGVAERTGLMPALSREVLDQACRQVPCLG